MKEAIKPQLSNAGYKNQSNIVGSHSKEKGKTQIYVEGLSDQRLFEQLFIKNSCRFFLGNGKEGAIKHFKAARVNKSAICIVDRDYDFILGLNEDIEGLFYTDSHDLETMVIDAGVFDIFIKLKGITDNPSDFKDNIVNAALPIGYLRLLSVKEGNILKFKTNKAKANKKKTEYLNYDKFFKEKSYQLDENNLIEQVYNKSTPCIINKKEIEDKLKAEKQNKYNEMELCHGKDLLFLILVRLGKPSNEASLNDIQYDLYGNYYYGGFFKETQLHKSLSEWIENNPQQINLLN